MIPKGYDYDNVMIIPHFSELESRTEPDTHTWIAKNCEVNHPIIPANMDCIAGKKMREVQKENGGGFIWHRHHKNKADITPGDFFTIGMREWYEDREAWKNNISNLIEEYGGQPCIDIAHAHTRGVLRAVEDIKSISPNTRVIVGNIATGDAARDLCNAGVDALKVGIGGGYACTTRKVTGCGVPNLTAIHWVYKVSKNFGVPIIADGGIKSSADIAKALAVGADCVMVGRLLAGSDEAEGNYKVVLTNGTSSIHETLPYLTKGEGIYEGIYRQYWGQSSEEFQNHHYGGMKVGVIAEGIERWVETTSKAQWTIDSLNAGLRSAMTYVGAKTIKSFREKAELIEVI